MSSKKHADWREYPNPVEGEWSGSPDPDDPANFWIDDVTGERIAATHEGVQAMSSNTLIPATVTIRKYPKHVEATARKGAFRVYKSEPRYATIQLRGEAFFATWAFASRANLDEIIAALTAIRDELAPEEQGWPIRTAATSEKERHEQSHGWENS